MASIAKGFGVDGERAKTPADVKAALARARRHNAEGKPYLIDAEVARHGPGWADDHWVPTIRRT
jgi:thiamine pyrophosphate-dependent acetolactate synthase large subunit-like protein